MPEEREVSPEKNDLIALIRAMQSEHSQLAELSEVELQDVRKLVSGLKVLQAVVEQAIPIRGSVLGDAFDGVQSAYLVSDCVVLVSLENGTILSRPLNGFSSRIVLSVIEEAVPELSRLISEQRKDLHARINLLERALKELKRTESAMKQSREHSAVPAAEDDIIRRTITGSE